MSLHHDPLESAILDPEDLPCPSPPREAGALEAPARSLRGVDGEEIDLGAERISIDIDTPREQTLDGQTGAASLIGIAAATLGIGYQAVLPAEAYLFLVGAILVSALLTASRSAARDEFQDGLVLDNRRREIQLALRDASRWTTHPIRGFAELRAVGVNGWPTFRSRRTAWYYCAIAVFRDGRRLRLSRATNDLGRVNDLARGLAEHLGVEFRPGAPEKPSVGDPQEPRLLDEVLADADPARLPA